MIQRSPLLPALLLMLAAGVAPIPGQGADAPSAATTAPAPASPSPQQLTAAAAARTYECETEAFGMDFEPFKRTKGAIRITLDSSLAESRELAPGPAGPIAGRWRVEGPSDTHVASIAKLAAETCAKGCPFTMTAKGEAQLWAPAPNSLDKLAATEHLTVAVLKPAPLSVSISTFRGQDIVALEKGACRSILGDGVTKVDAAAPTEPATPVAPEK